MANSLPPSDSNSQLLSAIKKLTSSITHGTINATKSVVGGVANEFDIDMTRFAGDVVSGINPILGSFTDKILEKSKGEIKDTAISAYKQFKIGSSHLLNSTKTFFSHQRKSNIELHKRLSLSSKSLTDSFKTQGSVSKQLLKETTKSTITTKGIISAIDLLRKTNIQLMTMVARRLSKTPITTKEYNLLKPDVARFPHLATGGIVEKGGMAVVHNNEKIIPSRVVDVQTSYLKRIAEATEATSIITDKKFNRRGSFSLEGKEVERQTLMIGKLIKKFDFNNKLDRTLKSAELSNIAARKSFAESSMVRKLWRGLVTRPSESYAGTEGGQIIEELKGLRRSIGGNKKYSLMERMNLTYNKILASMPFMEATANLTKWIIHKSILAPKFAIGGIAKTLSSALRWSVGGSKSSGLFKMFGEGTKYSKHVIVKDDPTRTTAKATAGIYEWTRIYGLQITSQLNKILEKFNIEKEDTYLTEIGKGSKQEAMELRYGAPTQGLPLLIAESNKFLQKILFLDKVNAKANLIDAKVEQNQLALIKKQEKQSIWEKAKAKSKSEQEDSDNKKSIFGYIKSLGASIISGVSGIFLGSAIGKGMAKHIGKALLLFKNALLFAGKSSAVILAGAIGAEIGTQMYKYNILGARTISDTLGEFIYNFPKNFGEGIYKITETISEKFKWVINKFNTIKQTIKETISSLAGELVTKIKNTFSLFSNNSEFVESKKITKSRSIVQQIQNRMSEDKKFKELYTTKKQKLYGHGKLTTSQMEELYGNITNEIRSDRLKEYRETHPYYGKTKQEIRNYNLQKYQEETEKLEKNKDIVKLLRKEKKLKTTQSRKEHDLNIIRSTVLNSDIKFKKLQKMAQNIERDNANKPYVKSALFDQVGRLGAGIVEGGKEIGNQIASLFTGDEDTSAYNWKTMYKIAAIIPNVIMRGATATYESEAPVTNFWKNRSKKTIRKAYDQVLKRKKILTEGNNSITSKFLKYIDSRLTSVKKKLDNKDSALLEISGLWYLINKDGSHVLIDDQDQLQKLKNKVIDGKIKLISANGESEYIIGSGKKWYISGKENIVIGKKTKSVILSELKNSNGPSSFIQSINNKLPIDQRIENNSLIQNVLSKTPKITDHLNNIHKSVINNQTVDELSKKISDRKTAIISEYNSAINSPIVDNLTKKINSGKEKIKEIASNRNYKEKHFNTEQINTKLEQTNNSKTEKVFTNLLETMVNKIKDTSKDATAYVNNIYKGGDTNTSVVNNGNNQLAENQSTNSALTAASSFLAMIGGKQ